MTRAVVTGASGLLGGAVLRELAVHADAVEGWSHRVARAPDGVAFRRLDLRSAAAVDAALGSARPTLVVHCAALTDVDACEEQPAAAHTLNAEVPGRLAAAAHVLGARFVHVSTDAVYDGERLGRHAEDEAPGPANRYAQTKLAGEQAVLAADPGALVVRTTMHGWTAQGRRSFSEAIAHALLRGRRLTLFADVRFSPVNVTDLAVLIRRLAQHRGAAGVLNVGAAAAVSKAEFGHVVARELGLDAAPIEPIALADAGLRAARPRNTELDVDRFTQLLGAAPPTVEAGVVRLVEELRTGAAARLKGRAPGTLAALLEDARE